MPQGVEDELHDPRVVEVEGVAATGAVDLLPTVSGLSL